MLLTTARLSLSRLSAVSTSTACRSMKGNFTWRQLATTFEASTRKKVVKPPIETVDMGKVMKQTFERIRDYVDPLLIPNNYKFSVAILDGDQADDGRGGDQLVLNVGAKGTYKFHYSTSTGRLIYLSPVSGSQQYVYDIDSKAWMGYRDGHDFFGILTRDLIRHSIGLPKIT